MSDNQRVQRELVQRGLRIPGVAEAMEAYGVAAKLSGMRFEPPPPRTRYAAGANSQGA